jgi:hypothetical protein
MTIETTLNLLEAQGVHVAAAQAACEDAGISHLPVRINGRLRRTLGQAIIRARSLKRPGQRRQLLEAEPVRIELHAKVRTLEAAAYARIFLHEVAHCLQPGDGHGWRFRIACRQIGADPAPKMRVGIGTVAKRTIPVAACTRCDYRIMKARRTRNSKYARSVWLHRGCGGVLRPL